MIQAADLAATLTAQAAAFVEMAELLELRAYAGRIATNLRAIGSGGADVVMAGGDLYRIAQAAYGDASEWATIAKANALSDPVLQGVQRILVPAKPGATGGVMQDLASLDGAAPDRSVTVSEVAGVGATFDFEDPESAILIGLL